MKLSPNSMLTVSMFTDDFSVASIIKEKYEQQQAQGNGGHELLAGECIQLIIQLINPYHHTTIIVDALDDAQVFTSSCLIWSR